MTTKSLSTSTLSLRFMQNAHRAKQMKEVELDRAEVKDDGKWEVSQVVRDSWGLSKESEAEFVDVHEESYLPFMFAEKTSDSNDVDTAAKKTIGRRIFNKKGEEISTKAPESEPPDASVSSSSNVAPPTTGRKIHPRPISISASGKSGQLRGFEQLKPPKDAKTAKQAIFENSGVGVDIRALARKDAATPAPKTFMKPAGVDDPKDIQTPSLSAPLSTSERVIGSLWQKSSKRQREAEATHTGLGETNAKPKKKKKKSSDP